jgi:Protein of unknown function (DUF3088)
MRDTLFVLRPGFSDRGARWFCPFSAQVMGFLTYYPEVRQTLDVVELEFPRPRKQIVDLVGEGHQGAPLLVLGDDAPGPVPGVTLGQANGHSFVEKTMQILRYLAHTRGVPGPH